MSETTSPAAIPPPPRRTLRQRVPDIVIWGTLAVLLIIAFGPAELYKLPLLFTQSSNMVELGRGFTSPDFTQWQLYVSKMWQTIQMAIWGTFLAIITATPLGLLASRNITPAWIQWPIRRALDIVRSIPDLVIGMIFLVAVGPGPLAGVMALAIGTSGVLAKLFSEAVESIDRGPVEGVRATGAAKLHEVIWGVIPQVAPLWTSYALYRFESNSRSATVLGLIGAGGIGQVLFDSLNAFNYSATAAIVAVIIVAVIGIDMLSQAIRSRLL
ncbi:MAG: phosphonate ABC transporter, permease protein PhnE [Phenylobacterium sp.]|uniref:phosphonate ABC transporter, permease protein PhnE n=1 Tax=Phenylobacterium sp. TaxID=1871053 RepID=UPI001A45DF69|nr:phosphonate ABC transporter, permease protein PhnE [Phenylobacterium sp.]MBL8774147.1 phosphonate ABC transporter, permease protein PhnE [Phenylobacterium sp.]